MSGIKNVWSQNDRSLFINKSVGLKCQESKVSGCSKCLGAHMSELANA